MIAGRELFDRHYEEITRFFRNKVKDRDFEDLVQQTFLGCVSGIDSFRRKSSFRTYIFAIATNQSRKYYRALARQRQHTHADFHSCSAIDLGATPSSVISRQREERLLLAALRRIPIEHQIVLELFYWEEMKAREIAEILGEPEPTVRRRLQRARKQLRVRIESLTGNRSLIDSTITNLEQWKHQLQQRLPKRQRFTSA